MNSCISVMKKSETFKFGPWTITSTKGTILKAEDIERISVDLDLHTLPEMVFGENLLQIEHTDGFGIQFNAIDALKCVDNKHDLMKVAVAEEWQNKRQDSEHIHKVVLPFDWTFTTDYRGTLTGKDGKHFKVTPTEERINIEKLKVKEKIYFYNDVILYEDELADNGCTKLSIKMRVMQESFFILLRFFMRVDGVLVRINDTRLYHEAGSTFLLREYSSKERKTSELVQLKCSLTDPSAVNEYLLVKEESFEKLEFPRGTESLTNGAKDVDKSS